MSPEVVVSVISLVVALAAAGLSAFFAARQSRLTSKTNLLPVLLEMFQEFRATEFKQHLDYVLHDLRRDFPDSDVNVSRLSDVAKTHFSPVASYFNILGIIAANEVVEGRVISGFMRGSILRAWSQLAPYIENERKFRQDPNYYLYFENLAFIQAALTPETLGKQLGLARMPAEWEIDFPVQVGRSESSKPATSRQIDRRWDRARRLIRLSRRDSAS